MKAALLFLALAGCDATYQLLADGDYGTVYVCNSGAMCEGGREEWCWDGDVAELEALLGPDVECHSIRIDERAWPALVGCAYCCGDGCGGPGANAGRETSRPNIC